MVIFTGQPATAMIEQPPPTQTPRQNMAHKI